MGKKRSVPSHLINLRHALSLCQKNPVCLEYHEKLYLYMYCPPHTQPHTVFSFCSTRNFDKRLTTFLLFVFSNKHLLVTKTTSELLMKLLTKH
uniref:Uncharacterized protein n=1 Tax=Anguilla anguilla TaxID=7936 RepID=A0A0E9X159_ANGAN